MKNFKKIIGILLLIIFIICIIIATFLLSYNKKNKEKGNKNDNSYIENYVEGDTVAVYNADKLRDPSKFFSVEKCIKDNIDDSFVAKDMRILEGTRIFNYAVYGEVYDNNENKDKYFIVRVDIENLTFEIEEIEDKEKISLDEINLETNLTKIDNDGNNEFSYISISNEDMARIYLEKFIELELNNPEGAYKLLDEKYRSERFGNIDGFIQYINEYRNTIEKSVLSKYSVEDKGNYTEYVLVDNYNNSFFIKETSIMNYTIMLDNYTIKVDTYLEDYNKLTEENKVKTNSYIFIQMINTKDYEHAYKLLDQTFKMNNFDNIDKFKEYIKNNLFYYNLNTMEDSVEKKGNYYIYKTKIKSDSSSIAEYKNLSIIMQLQEDSKFVMSFSID